MKKDTKTCMTNLLVIIIIRLLSFTSHSFTRDRCAFCVNIVLVLSQRTPHASSPMRNSWAA